MEDGDDGRVPRARRRALPCRWHVRAVVLALFAVPALALASWVGAGPTVRLVRLCRAASTGDTANVTRLAQDGVALNGELWPGFGTPLMYAAGAGHEGTVSALLVLGADPNVHERDDGLTALHLAAESGNADACRALLTAHANVNAVDEFGRTALHLAVLSGRHDAARVLLDAGADLNVAADCVRFPRSKHQTALEVARARRDADMVLLLTSHGA